MVDPRPCPYCGSPNAETFPDGSGRCGDCGRAIRGATPIGAMIMGERVEVKRASKVRDKDKVGVLGLVGGLLGWVGVPTAFVLGAVLRGRSLGDYIPFVFNTPSGAVVCGGIVFLVIGSLFAMWAGFYVWQGFPQRGVHLVAAGVIMIVSAALAGQGLAGVLGIVGGVVALVGGLLAWRTARAREAEGTGPAATGS